MIAELLCGLTGVILVGFSMYSQIFTYLMSKLSYYLPICYFQIPKLQGDLLSIVNIRKALRTMTGMKYMLYQNQLYYLVVFITHIPYFYMLDAFD